MLESVNVALFAQYFGKIVDILLINEWIDRPIVAENAGSTFRFEAAFCILVIQSKFLSF